jgi:hypothetical protein
VADEKTKSKIQMKTKSFHRSNMGSYAPACANRDGYITIHDSPRYGKATDEQLVEWTESRIKLVRNAALTERAERSLREWQKGSA